LAIPVETTTVSAGADATAECRMGAAHLDRKLSDWVSAVQRVTVYHDVTRRYIAERASGQGVGLSEQREDFGARL
jgi:hypothetical protein